MDELIIGLAISAVILAIVAMFFEIFFYRWQTQQGQSISDNVSTFANEMHDLVGELRGLTTGTQQTQQKQFQTMLDAFVERQGPEVKAAVEESTSFSVADLAEKISHIESLIEQSPQSAALRTELEAMRESLGSLQAAIPEAVARGMQSVTLDAGRPSQHKRPQKAHEVIADILINPLPVNDEDDAAAQISKRYGVPFLWFVERGLLEVHTGKGGKSVRVTEDGFDLARKRHLAAIDAQSE